MSTEATPFGAQPVESLVANGSFTGRVRHYKIASGYATDIFSGDFVKLVAAGTVEKDTGTSSMTPLGIFMGVSYTDPGSSQHWHNNYWPSGTAADDAYAMVLVDPYVVFKMQADGTLAQTALGTNVGVVQTAGSTSIGRSKNAVDASTSATTSTLPLKIIGFVKGPDSEVGDAYTDVYCMFNAGHQLLNTTGV